MDKFYGFDLGDAESAISVLKKENGQTPQMIPVTGQKSFISAYALLQNGDLKIGENACYEGRAARRKLRFKSRFLTDPSAAGDVKSFAGGVLGELYGNADLIKNEDCSFYIGCPAGWNKNTRERYREIFEQVGYPPLKIVSESRAALVNACQSKHLQVGYDILSKPVLVVDIGSSTTDFAYVCRGREVDIRTAGEVFLGGGIMDEILLENAVAASPDADRIRSIFAESEPWKNYCEFAARRLKEKYFSDEEYFKTNRCAETVMIHYNRPTRLTLIMNEEIADALLNRKSERLGNRSFREVFIESLENVRKSITGENGEAEDAGHSGQSSQSSQSGKSAGSGKVCETPELLFLTGGVSRLPAIRSWCEEIFPEAVVINGAEPEFSVSRGLAWCGKIDEEVRAFRQDLENLNRSSVVEDIVRENIDDLYRRSVDALVEPLIRNVAVPVFERWRKGEIRRLADTDRELEKEIENYLHSDSTREILIRPIKEWLRPVSDRLEIYTVPICLKHNIPYTSLSLRSCLAASDIDIHIDAGNIFGVKEITWLIDSIMSMIIGLLCGGSGIALISSGLPGILIGFAASFLVLALGKNWMEKAILDADIPVFLRKLMPRNYFETRIDSISGKARESLYQTLETEKNEEITARTTTEISEQIEECLTRMAEIVEIPLG